MYQLKPPVFTYILVKSPQFHFRFVLFQYKLYCTTIQSKVGTPTFPALLTSLQTQVYTPWQTSLEIASDCLCIKWTPLCFILAISNQSLQVCTCNTTSKVCVLYAFDLMTPLQTYITNVSNFNADAKTGKLAFFTNKIKKKKTLKKLKTTNGETFK